MNEHQRNFTFNFTHKRWFLCRQYFCAEIFAVTFFAGTFFCRTLKKPTMHEKSKPPRKIVIIINLRPTIAPFSFAFINYISCPIIFSCSLDAEVAVTWAVNLHKGFQTMHGTPIIESRQLSRTPFTLQKKWLGKVGKGNFHFQQGRYELCKRCEPALPFWGIFFI